jgi:hypothetical protein
MTTDTFVSAGSAITPRVTWRPEPPITRAKRRTARSIRVGTAVVATCFLEALLILGFVVASLGIDPASQSVAGPITAPRPGAGLDQ